MKLFKADLEDSAFFSGKSLRFFRFVSGVFPALFWNHSGKKHRKKAESFKFYSQVCEEIHNHGLLCLEEIVGE